MFKTKANNNAGGDYAIPPAGSIPATLVACIDLGTHETEYQGTIKTGRKIYLVWELPGEVIAGTKNHHVIGREYAFNPDGLHAKSTLRKDLERWRGKAYGDDEPIELTKLLGKSCLLSIEHKKSSSGNEYAKLTGVASLPRGTTVAPTQRTPFCWSIDHGEATLQNGQVVLTNDRNPPSHDWLPFLFGKAVKDVIAASFEKTGKSSRREREPGDEEPEDHGGNIPF